MYDENQTVEPVSRLFLSQAADEAFALGLIDEPTLRFVFNMNCLFFDHLAVGATDLLGNPLFFNMIRKEPEAMSALYKQGVLQPIVYGKCDRIEDVANMMLENDTIYMLEDKRELEKHAQAVTNAAPACLWAPEEEFRLTYCENMLAVFDYLNSVGAIGASPHHLAFDQGTLTELISFVRSFTDSGDLRCSQVYRFADERLPSQARPMVKLVAESLFQYALSTTQSAALSLADQAEQVVCRAKQLLTVVGDSIPKLADGDTKTEEFSLSLPLNAIARLDVGDLLVVRSLPGFQDIRRSLAGFRVGRGRTDPLALRSQLNECGTLITKYASSTGFNRQLILRAVRQQRRAPRLRFVLEVATSATPIALALVFQGGIPLVIATAVAVLGLAGSRYVTKQERSPNTVHPEISLVRQREYCAATGGDREPNK